MFAIALFIAACMYRSWYKNSRKPKTYLVVTWSVPVQEPPSDFSQWEKQFKEEKI